MNTNTSETKAEVQGRMTFGHLAKGNYFRILNGQGEPSGSILEKTGVRSARRCDVTLPPMRFHLHAASPIVWEPLKEVA